MGLIYMAYNRITSKAYIGQTIKNIKHRKRMHIYNSKRVKNNNFTVKNYFTHTLRIYSSEGMWKWIVLEDDLDNSVLDKKEVYYIEKYNTFVAGYNSTKGGDFQPMHIKKIANKVSIAKRGIKFSDEHKKKLSESKIGKTHSEESKNKISETLKKQTRKKGYKLSKEHLNKLRTASMGENNAASILTEKDVLELYKVVSEGLNYSEIYSKFNVSNSHIRSILKGNAWSKLFPKTLSEQPLEVRAALLNRTPPSKFNKRAKLTDVDRIDIFEYFKIGVKVTELMDMYKCSKTHIHRIVKTNKNNLCQ